MHINSSSEIFRTWSLRNVEPRGASLTYSSIACINDAGGFITNQLAITSELWETMMKAQDSRVVKEPKENQNLLNLDKCFSTSEVKAFAYFVKLR